jgi:prepilin-type N-terminal cleavage/methylation domain-containing protein
MTKKTNYKGFTLVEMLIVMGILAILMAIGVAVGRFAIQRANNIQHNSAAEQLSQAVASYYVDNRKYPAETNMAGTGFGTNAGPLDPYIDAEFDGGSDATYYYYTDSTQQSYLVCVSYGGVSDTAQLGGYCTGNGFGSLPSGGAVTKKTMNDTEFTVVVGSSTGVKVLWEDNAWNGDQTSGT